ncbi:MAG: amino acid adenylation domain-containing protein [Acidobacteriota bacterium]
MDRAAIKRELLEQLLKKRGFDLPTETTIPRRKKVSPSPLSFAQQRLWFLHQLEPKSSVYHVYATFLLKGELKIDALSRSLNRIIERHETLRTSFGYREGQPCQLITMSAPVSLRVEDLSRLEPAEREPTALARARAEAEWPFDLRQAPQLRVRLMRLSEREHLLLLSLHHIVCDGWSMEVLFAELGQFYNGGVEAEVGELPVQYADYALWQREQLQGAALEAQLAYWRGQFRGELPVLELPTDRVRPAVQTYRGGVERRQLSRELRAALDQLGQQHGATLFMVLLAAFQVLLWRYTGQEQIVVGTPVANRQRAEIEGLIGFFVNTLALRSTVRGEQAFTELLAEVKETCLEAYAHQDLPFEKLVEELQPERTLAHSPLFQVMLTMRSDQRRPLRLRGIEATPLSIEQSTAKFDWLLYTFVNEKGLQAALEYNSDLFDRTTAKRVLAHYEQLLQGLIANPAQRLAELPLLTRHERQQLLVNWNNTQTEFPQHLSLAQLFEAQAAKTPDAPALRFEGTEFTYRQLNQHANRLAHYLREQGVCAEDRVGILLERSAVMVVALLGVLKAGGCYVPLDPQYPQERLAFMSADAGLKVLLTTRPLAESLHLEESGMRLLLVDEWEWDGDSELETGNDPGVEVNEHQLAYLIYTSGSTGQPKGVAIEHASATTFIHWAGEIFDQQALGGVLFSTSICFDLSIFELFVTLSHGGQIILADNALQLPELQDGAEVTLINTVPSAMAALVRTRAVPDSVRVVNLAGEPLSEELVAEIYATTQVEKVYNLYGPTEDTTYSTYTLVSSGEWVTIGRPVANTRVYVLDEHWQPVPVGVVGELYLGGSGLARGYWRRPELTAEKFIPDSLSGEKGKRLYRTGDKVRYLANGKLEFLGRADHQMKLRGYRIELGEIESVLRRNDQVREAIVVVQEPAGGEKQLVAYVVADDSVKVSGLRKWLKERLPEYMIPAALVLMQELPLTPNGKVDRRALPDPDMHGTPEETYVAPQTELEQSLATIWQEVLGLERVGLSDNFFDLGGHSLLLVQVQSKLREHLDRPVPVLDLFKYPTIGSLAKHLSTQSGPKAGEVTDADSWFALTQARALARRRSAGATRDVAIIGMAGRFPGAANLEEFWQNLRQGVESIREFSEEEVRAAGVSEQLLRQDRYVRAGAILDGVDLFDAEFFGITPREAEIMDPQQRLFLECAWETIENAGYDAASYPLPIGVFAGLSMNTYLPRLYASITSTGDLNNTQVQLGNDKDFVSTRVSYKLGLTGPSLTVQTACSTSLVAVHLACQSLLAGECSIALAGGVSLRFPQKGGYLFQEGGIKSPDGHCRAFDARAAGTVGGSGVGLVLLKPLTAALTDGDAIYAVIKGSAINNDGALKVGYTAPSVTGQATVIAEAQAMAGVSPETISYIEAHGTGTPLGDPIEVAALRQAFGKENGLGHYCALGSVKTNIGHLDAAAGVAGLIKTVLSLNHQELAPTLHYERPNPEIDFERSPFYVNAELNPWPRTEGRPRRAGVSSFGIGGTNAHVVLEEAPLNNDEISAAENDNTGWNFLLLSARNEESLKAGRKRLADHLEQHPDHNLDDVAYTLQVGRRSFAQRTAVICRTAGEAIAALRDDKTGINVSGEELRATKGIVFLFPGQGAQQVNMGRSLYETHGDFRRVVDECSEVASAILGYDLRTVLYPDPLQEQEAQQQLRETALTQVVLFTVEYALAEQLRVWGIRPAALLGHSLGEYVAACVSGTFSMEEAVKLVAERGRLMQQMPPGVMLAVTLEEPELREALAAASNGSDERLWVTSLNGPQRNVVGGSVEAIEELEQYLNDKKVRTQRLQTSHAFHTGLVDPVLEQYRAVVEKTVRHPNLQVRYVSNTSGCWATAAEVQQTGYWVRHMREPVKFRAGVTEIAREGNWLWLEVGPGRALSRLVRQQLQFLASESQNGHQAPRATDHNDKVLTTLSDGEGDELARMLRSIGELWTCGTSVNWEALRVWSSRHAGVTPRKPRRVWLPPYAFQRQRFWLEPPARQDEGPSLERKTSLTDWFYIPSWKRSMPPKLEVGARQQLTWLVFVDQNGLGSHLVARLKKSDQNVVSVVAGSEFIATGNGIYVIDPREQDDYDKLLLELKRANQTPQKVVHLWTAGQDADLGLGFDLLEIYQRIGFYSLLYLAQALSLHLPEDEIRIDVVSTDLHAITGDEKLRPEQATLLGACKVISQEISGLSCRSIDVRLSPGESVSDELVDQLLAEFSYEAADPVVAYRGEHRWIQSFESVELKPAPIPFKSKGVYLITGGLGGIGLTVAEHLGRSMQARLVLTGRSEFPDRESWESWLANHREDDPISCKIGKLVALEKAGAEVLLCQADVADEPQMRRVAELANQRFGTINGVIHAAGIAGGGLIQRRTREMMEHVLAPKTKGTLVLDRVFKDTPLDFMVLCSSISSILGGVGGADYCAANSFLDAYAQYRRREARVFSINWDKWLETGMAVDTPQSRWLSQNGSAGDHQETGHPLIGICTHRSATEQTFETLLSAKTHWILREHRIRGKGVLPGTAYLEMARAALEQCRSESKPIEIREITFVSPLVVGDHEARNVRVTVTQNEDTFAFDIASKPAAQNGSESQWVRHASGTMNYLDDASRRTIDLQAIKERCVETEIESLRRPATQRSYGPRWQTMRQVYFGKDEGLAVFELPEEYAADLHSLTWHPALLDFAMSFLAIQYLDQGMYLPFNYHQLKVKAPLPRRLCSYAKFKPSDDPLKKQLAFELLITDDNGNELIEVKQFTMRRASGQFNSEPTSDEIADNDAGHGLRSSEGIQVLERVLGSSTLPQIIVSTRDFPALCRHYQGVKASTAVKAIAAAKPVTSLHARPALTSSYEAPRNEMEGTIAELWQRVLGIEKIGIYDDFLELGGDSLAALQLMSRLRETFDVEPPLARFFESPTISSLALLVVQQLAESTDTSVLSEILLEVERSSRQPLG